MCIPESRVVPPLLPTSKWFLQRLHLKYFTNIIQILDKCHANMIRHIINFGVYSLTQCYEFRRQELYRDAICTYVAKHSVSIEPHTSVLAKCFFLIFCKLCKLNDAIDCYSQIGTFEKCIFSFKYAPSLKMKWTHLSWDGPLTQFVSSDN